MMISNMDYSIEYPKILELANTIAGAIRKEQKL